MRRSKCGLRRGCHPKALLPFPTAARGLGRAVGSIVAPWVCGLTQNVWKSRIGCALYDVSPTALTRAEGAAGVAGISSG